MEGVMATNRAMGVGMGVPMEESVVLSGHQMDIMGLRRRVKLLRAINKLKTREGIPVVVGKRSQRSNREMGTQATTVEEVMVEEIMVMVMGGTTPGQRRLQGVAGTIQPMVTMTLGKNEAVEFVI